MGEYLLPIILMSSALGFMSFVSYPSSNDKTLKFAASVLIIYVALTPCIGFIKDIYNMDFDEYFEDIKSDTEIGSADYIKVTEEAFKEGICKLLITKYDIKRENISIYIFGFDFENMKGESIKVILSGRACLADFRGMEEYLNSLSLGECTVELDI